MFLKHGAKTVNEIELVAPTGFEPVFESRRAFASDIASLGRV
jgi:hypothetical protein